MKRQRVTPLPFLDEELSANQLLARYHYLGAIGRGEVYRDGHGVMVFTNPSSRRLPADRWVELVRWCLLAGGHGSEQWRAASAWLRRQHPGATTVVSYSDPAAGHTGALYRACNWLWAPTWHRLREPPTGNGAWTEGDRQAVKDRWVTLLAPDTAREGLLTVKDDGLRRRFPWACYVEPKWKRGVPQLHSGGGDYKRFIWKEESEDEGLRLSTVREKRRPW